MHISNLCCHKSVCAITITYNPDIDIFRSQVKSLQNQCAMIVVDNGSTNQTLLEIQAAIEGHPRAHLISFEQNCGIASAQNKGIEYAKNNDWDISYFLTLDHDSVPHTNLVERLVNGAELLKNKNVRVGAVGPVLFDPRSNSRLKLHKLKGVMWQKVLPKPSGGLISVASLNSSGSLISASALRECGMFDESFFIDHVETEWCFRALSLGWEIYVDQTTEMEHRMGDDVVRYWLFGQREMPYRSPTRHYYIVRNSITLLKKSYVPTVWKFWNIMKLLFTGIYFGLISTESSAHRLQIIRGFKDGYSGNRESTSSYYSRKCD